MLIIIKEDNQFKINGFILKDEMMCYLLYLNCINLKFVINNKIHKRASIISKMKKKHLMESGICAIQLWKFNDIFRSWQSILQRAQKKSSIFAH